MPKQAKELSAIEVRQMVQPGLHAVGGVTGLYLTVAQTRARSWILRVKIGNKRREMGLGGFPDVTLADARAKARILRQQISEGIDPVEQKAEARIALKREQDALTFKEAVELFWALLHKSPLWRASPDP
ncbi:Arm DNA-binding domain-containing protein [Octadecabacter antarcticus]|uniref:Arm DNA-binding domain-containing protein n=1 Tax=Octadecabacter antarcticus TaxID=1217908 RepID=UPI0005C79722|nr:Arm DNA-binding domain-containing protein [Octadecabacter antarcticus]